MHLLILLAVLAALVSAEGQVQTAVPAGFQRLLLTLTGLAIVSSAAWVVSAATSYSLYRNVGARRLVLERFEKLQFAHTLLWLGVSAVILFGLEWAAVVRGNWKLDGTFLIDELLIVAPVLLGQIFSWAVFYDVDCAVRNTTPHSHVPSESTLSRGGFVALHARHYFGLVLIPLLAVFAARDLSEIAAPQSFADGPPWGAFLLVLAAVGFTYPLLLRFTWDTQPLSHGSLRQSLEDTQTEQRVKTREILVWRTNGRIVNAAVTGALPLLRYVFLSDGLLRRLSDGQIVAIFKHELGHVRCRHPQLRLLALAAPLAVWQATTILAPDLVDQMNESVHALSGGNWLLSLLIPLSALGLYGVTFFCWYARVMEFQADLNACGIYGGRTVPSDDQQEQARVLVSALYRLTQINGESGAGLLHPSLGARITFIRHAMRSQQTAYRFEARMRLIAALLIVTVAIGFLVPLINLLSL